MITTVKVRGAKKVIVVGEERLIVKSKDSRNKSVSPLLSERGIPSNVELILKKKPFKKLKLYINVFNCRYDIVREVAKDQFKFRI